MQEAKINGSDIIKNLSREKFHKYFVRGICQTEEFSALTSFRAENTPENFKKKVRNSLKNLGIPIKLIQSDSDLDNIVTAIVSRSVTLQ